MNNSQLPGQGFCNSIFRNIELPLNLPGLTQSFTIQLKALFLLLVFSMNTVVGFACSIGLDMGFNTHQQDGTTLAKIHVHADGQKHVHQPSSGKHSQNKSHHHKKDDDSSCCNEKVTKFEQLDKSVTSAINLISPVFFAAFVSTYYYLDIIYALKISPSTKYFARSYHPPIPDIRIAIQSFQI